MQARKLGEPVKNIERGRGEEKLERDSARSLQEKPDRGSQINSQTSRAHRDGSAEDPEGTSRPLVADEGEGVLKGERDGRKIVGQEIGGRENG